MNSQRIREGQAPFPAIEDFLEDFLIIRVREFIKEMDHLDSTAVQTAYADASDSQQAQVRTILGV